MKNLFKSLMVVSGAVMMASPVMASPSITPNESTVYQSVNCNTAAVGQIGGNWSAIVQVNPHSCSGGNKALVLQSGSNQQLTGQFGYSNTAVTEQDGYWNQSGTLQFGAGNVAETEQDGRRNQAGTAQFGVGNTAETEQDGRRNRALTIQDGYGNSSLVDQNGYGNAVVVVQMN